MHWSYKQKDQQRHEIKSQSTIAMQTYTDGFLVDLWFLR